MWSDLPAPQRSPSTRSCCGRDTGRSHRPTCGCGGVPVDRSTCSADDEPVLLAIDDLQWLDPSSVHVVAFAARRLTGPVGFLGAVRTEHDTTAQQRTGCNSPGPTRQPDSLPPLSIRALIRRRFPKRRRRIRARRWAVSTSSRGGNPFYAIELAGRSTTRSLRTSMASLPNAGRSGSRQDRQPWPRCPRRVARRLVHDNADRRAGREGDRHRPRSLVDLLEFAEDKGIIAIEGNRIQLHTSAAGQRCLHQASRRSAARCIAASPISSTSRSCGPGIWRWPRPRDDDTLRALDEAAESAHARGAPRPLRT